MQTSNSMSDWLNFDTDAGGSLSNGREMDSTEDAPGILDSMVCLSPSMVADTEPVLDMQDIAAEAKAASNVPSPDLIHSAEIKEESNPKPNLSSDDVNPLSDIVNCSFDSIIGDFAGDKSEELETEFQSGINFSNIFRRNEATSNETLQSDVIMDSVLHVPPSQDSHINSPITLDTEYSFDSILSDLKCSTVESQSADVVMTRLVGTGEAVGHAEPIVPPAMSEQSSASKVVNIIASISPIESAQESIGKTSLDTKSQSPAEPVLVSSPKEGIDKGPAEKAASVGKRRKSKQKSRKRSSTDSKNVESSEECPVAKRRKSAAERVTSATNSKDAVKSPALASESSVTSISGSSESLICNVSEVSGKTTLSVPVISDFSESMPLKSPTASGMQCVSSAEMSPSPGAALLSVSSEESGSTCPMGSLQTSAGNTLLGPPVRSFQPPPPEESQLLENKHSQISLASESSHDSMEESLQPPIPPEVDPPGDAPQPPPQVYPPGDAPQPPPQVDPPGDAPLPPLPRELRPAHADTARPPLPPDLPPPLMDDCNASTPADSVSQPPGNQTLARGAKSKLSNGPCPPTLPAESQPSGCQPPLPAGSQPSGPQPPLPADSQPSGLQPPLPEEPHPSEDQDSSTTQPASNHQAAPQSDDTVADILDQEFEIIDELGSEDEEGAGSDSEDEYGPDFEEIDAMLDEGMKSVPTPEQAGDKTAAAGGVEDEAIKPEQREKVVLKERGLDPFDILPEGWVQVTHSSGMPVYLHKASRVCTMSRPYFLGPGSARHHDMPLSAIPCFLYRKELEKEKLGLTSQPPAENGVADSSGKPNEPHPAVNGQAAMARSQVKVESVENYKKEKTLSYLEVRKYCENLFEFNTLTIKKFKTWKERRKHAKQMKEQRRPTLPSNTKLITCPILYNEDDRPNKKKEFQLNPVGKSVTCILHEYAQHAMKVQPKYVFNEVEKSATPYSATVVINDVEYSTAFGKCKKVAKNEAARLALQVLLPEFKDITEGNSKDIQHDLSFFDEVKIEDARVTELSAKTGMPSPYQILCECLRRNFGMGNTQCHMQMNTLKNLKSEFTMTVGKHSATVVVKNKREGKQRAAQAILQRLHPHIHSWASLYRLYGSESINDLRTNKEEEDVTSLHPRERQNQPNFAVLNKLRSEMSKMQERRTAMKAKVKGKLEMEPGTTMTSVAAVDL